MEAKYKSPQNNWTPNNIVLEPIVVTHKVEQGKSEKQRFNSNKLNDLCNNRYGSHCGNDVMRKIHKGYLEFIKDLKKSNNDKTFTTENLTSKNILKRRDDIANKILHIKKDNKRLETLLTSKQTEQHEMKSKYRDESKVNAESLEHVESEEVVKVVCDISRKFSTSLYYTKSWQKENILNIDKLQSKYDELQCNLNCLQLSVRNKFERKEKYKELKEYLCREEKTKEEIGNYNEQLKDILHERKQQIQILKEELAEKYPNEKPSLKYANLSDPLLPLLKDKKFDSDEPKDCKLVSSYIQCINRFNEQFQQQNYKFAAQLAANSHGGILRNYTTFLQFKNDSNNISNPASKSSPAFIFCEALIKTSSTDGIACENLSLEIIRCATFQDDINLLEHWLQSVIITWSKSIGDLLISGCKCLSKCRCGWTYLALQVYSELKLYKGIILCHLKFNNFKHVMIYMKRYEFSDGEFKQLLSSYPHIQLSYLLSDVTVEKPHLTLAGVVSTLLDEKMNDSIIDLLTNVYTNGLHGESLLDCLLKETVFDDMGEEKWEVVLNICKCSGNDELAEELYACLCTRYCLNNATIFCLCDYIS